ncbi:S9 family peptidase [Photobacterium sanctipauli]|uniref:S9 family peptidase n=1 Tax=Photobacterium sanctipauli TaxID=1342794 RepID=A0A2T3NQJ8_9GAMM|nr:prolyl oligopeptidase family serine peptidase [Photobacterium sanctipauli]PSW18554.1 S9 family peptidase [Photobacterium sanctipauli]
MKLERLSLVLCGCSLLMGGVNAFAQAAEEQNKYQWLRDDSRQSARVIAFLQHENKRSHDNLALQAPLEEELAAEWRSRQRIASQNLWLRVGAFEYQLVNDGKQYGIARKPHDKVSAATIIDLGSRAEQSKYYNLGAWRVSPDHRYIALAEDRRGDRNYQISIFDTQEGTFFEKVLSNASTDLVWGADSQSLIWVENEAKTYRPYRAKQWFVSSRDSKVLFTEPSLDWLVSVYASASKRHAIIQSNNHNTSEQRILELSTGKQLGVIRPREDGIEYYADLRQDKVFISSNISGAFALYQTSVSRIPAPWTPIWQLDEGQHLKNWFLYPSHLVLEVATQQKSELVILDQALEVAHQHEITPPGGVAWLSSNGQSDENSVLIRSMSMAQPAKWLQFDLDDFSQSTLSQDSYTNFDPRLYRSVQIMVEHEGVSIPVSIAYRHDRLNAKSPVVLYGYGAYGTPMRPYFMPQIMSLLDRGMIYAIAHVRGGGFLGPDWYQQGRGVNKPNSILDFIAVAQQMKLYAQGDNRPVLAMGGSAGGTLVAAAINAQPQLFAAAVMQVPFVDVVATMSDPELPLTRQEYAEWGNPNVPEQLAIMRQYSPVDNIRHQSYPPMLVTGALHDSQVPYWEPARWVAKVRDFSLAKGPYLLLTDMDGGHLKDRRLARQQQIREYAFLIHQAETAEVFRPPQ